MKQTSHPILRQAVILAMLALAAALALSASSVATAAQISSGHRGETAFADTLAQASSEPLTVGCNQIVISGATVGSKVGDWVAQNVKPASAVISVWHFDNASQHYQAAFFNDPAVPVDQPAFTAAIDAFFLCVNASATAP